MSIDCSAAAILGVEVPVDKLKVKVRKRCCTHPETSAKFCPECGVPMWLLHEETIPELNQIHSPSTLAGEPLFFNYEDQRAFVGMLVTAKGYGNKDVGFLAGIDMPTNPISLVERLQQKLDPLGLWDVRRFGLYCVITCG